MANRVGAEKQRSQDERNAKIAQFGEALDKRNSNIANTAANAVVASTAQDAMDSVATQSQEQTERIMQALAYNRALDLNEVEAAQNAKRTDQTLARIEAVNAQSAALQTHANEMQQHFDARVKYGQQNAADALQRGINRGSYAASKNYQSPDLMAGVNVEGNIAAAIQRRETAYSSVGLGAGAANGSFGDFATWYGASLANESWQALQFMGKAVVNGLTLGTMNDRFSPFSSSYHSLIGDNTLFGNPTTFAGAVGRDSGVIGSYGIDPLAAVGVFGKLSRYDINLSLNGTPTIVSGQGSYVRMDGHKIYDSNFPALSSNPREQYRFSDPAYRSTGGDVYFGENVVTSYMEVQKNITNKSLFVGDVRIDNILDLTDPRVLKQMNIDPAKLTTRVDNPLQKKVVYSYTNQISNQAYDAGYNGILYSSSRNTGNNRAFVLFGERYDPDAIKLILNRQIKP
uniref:RES domain-containing protein n=1 Tax=Rheinheimera sp. BAL341 TaxID=1708203 RepID=A0A486XTN4_9GAMM